MRDQIQLRILKPRFGQALLRLELRDARCFFENRATISGTAAQNLPNASLLDQRVGLGSQARSHEQFLNIAQAAQLSVQQVFAVAGAEQAARDHDLARLELLLVELASANFQNHVRSRRPDGPCRCGRNNIVRGQRENRLIVREGDSNRIDLRCGELLLLRFFRAARLRRPASVAFGGAGANGGFIPIVGEVVFRKVVLNVDFSRRVGVGTVVGFGIDQRQRHFRHAGRLAVACPGEDHVFHARTAQCLGRLLAQHPRDGVGNIRLAASVGADDGRHTVSVELEFGAVTERLEPENLKPLQFEQRELLRNSGQLSAGCY